MNEEDLRQDFFISNDGYINLRLKVTTEDKVDRERIVAELMGKMTKEGFELPDNTVIDQLYFSNQNPLTVLKDIKKIILNDIESIFDESISRII